VFSQAPAAGQSNLSPYAGLQFFGEVNIDRDSKAMKVDLKDIEGTTVFSKILPVAAEVILTSAAFQ
jgi:alkaline phosphatase D